MTNALNPRQEAFCQEYLKDLNGKQAAIRAGYSERAASVQAARMLAKSNVSERIQKLKKKRAERTEIDADWVLNRLAQDASADVADLYDDHGRLKPVRQWPMAFRTGLVAGIDTVQEKDGTDEDGKPEFVTVRKVKLADRARFLEMIGKHIDVGAFKDKVELDVVDSLAARLERVRAKRAAK